MANSATLDLDESALVKRPRPTGWYVAALLGLVGAGIVGAFYLPLRSAHSKLVGAHAELAQKTGALDRTLRETRGELEKVRGEKDRLSGSASERERSERDGVAQLERIAGTLKAAQAKAVQAGWLKIETDAQGVRATLPTAKVFVGVTPRLTPAAFGPLCASGESLKLPGEVALRVVLHVATGADAKAWSLAAERASEISRSLGERCKLDPARTAVVLQPASSDESVELWLGAPRP
ncbi:MAG TPA: hypothetical protein VLC09_03615 [Polyangiaceae bacterium]|nr:hypothetical protein [Polyangiaceae bacterium]